MCKYEFSPPITRDFKLFDNYSPKEKSSRDFSLPPLSAYAKMISSFTISLAHARMLFICPTHFKAFSALSRSVIPCACFICSVSRSKRSCACLSISARYVFNLPLVRRLVYVTLRLFFQIPQMPLPPNTDNCFFFGW